jgi:hypothetical protein
MLLWIVVAVVVAIVIILWSLPHRAAPRDALDELVALCYGDHAVATRLVDAAARRAPVSSRRQHVLTAIEQLRYDRRR